MEINQPATDTQNTVNELSTCLCNQVNDSSIWEKDLDILASLLLVCDEDGVTPALFCLAEAVSKGLQRLEKEVSNSEVFGTLGATSVEFKVPQVVAELQHIAGFTPNPVTREGTSFNLVIDIPGEDESLD